MKYWDDTDVANPLQVYGHGNPQNEVSPTSSTKAVQRTVTVENKITVSGMAVL